MTDASAIHEHMDVIGADGVHAGTTTPSRWASSPASRARLSATGANAVLFEEEEGDG